MKKLFFLCLNVGIVFGQQKSAPMPIFKHEKLSLFMFLNHRMGEVSRKVIADSCMSSVAFAKFSVDSTGRVYNVHFTNDAPAAITSILDYMMKSTEGCWIPATVNNKFVNSRPFVLTLIFALEARCSPLTIQGGGRREFFEVGLHRMMLFDDEEKPTELDCVMIKPFLLLQ